MPTPKLKDAQEAKLYVLVESLCLQVHVTNRKRIGHTTANTWLRNMKPKIKRFYLLCDDGRHRAAVLKLDGARFVSAYRQRKASKVTA